MGFVSVPGIYGSGPTHWQSLWEDADPSMVRFEPADWDSPELTDWLEALDRAVGAAADRPVVVAHSLGCLAVAHWAAPDRVAGAFLVAPPDPHNSAFPAAATSFSPTPSRPLPFPSLLVVSTDDHYADPAFARRCADDWGSVLVVLQGLGHINADSGLGDWPMGRALLADFCTQLPG